MKRLANHKRVTRLKYKWVVVDNPYGIGINGVLITARWWLQFHHKNFRNLGESR